MYAAVVKFNTLSDTVWTAAEDHDLQHENVTFAELLPFRKLCKTKYDDMGIEFPFDIYPDTSQDVIEKIKPGLDKFVF